MLSVNFIMKHLVLFVAVFLSPPVPLIPLLCFPSSLSLLPPSHPPSSLYLPPPTQGDDPLNSADDDEDSDGEGAHFDTEDNIVCQFEKVCCSQQASPRWGWGLG